MTEPTDFTPSVYVPGPYDQPRQPVAPVRGPVRAPASGWPGQLPVAPRPPAGPPQRHQRTLWLMIGVLAGVVALLCAGGVATAAVVLSRRPNAAAAPSPSWHSVFGDNTAAPAVEPTTKVAPDPSYFNVPVGTPFSLTDHDGGAMTVTLTSAKTQKAGCDKYADRPDNGFYVVVA